MRSWVSRLRNVFRADRVGDEIDREMAFHLAQREDALVAAGMSRDDARHEARRRFGNVGLQKDSTRERDLLGWFEEIVADVRYAVRGLRAAPGFALVTIASLALGIGANTAVFTFINVAMLRSIPASHPEQLVQLEIEGGQESKGGSAFSKAMWEYFRDRQDVFAGVLAYGSTGNGDLSTGGEARPIPVGLVSGGFFSTLGIQPAAGRLFVSDDDRPGCGAIAVISHKLWMSDFGGDPAVAGKTLPINGTSFEILGVAEKGFIGLGFGYYPPVWVPQCAGGQVRLGYSGGGTVVARLRDDVPLETANARMSAFVPELVAATAPRGASAEDLDRHQRTRISAVPFRRGFPFLELEYGRALGILMSLVAIVLLIACANTANLLLARATARRGEVALRLALGASRWRLTRQLLTESLLIALASAAIGTVLAAAGTRALVALLSRRGRPLLTELDPDGTVLVFTIVTAVVTALIFGLAPAWRTVRVDAQSAMRLGARGVADGASNFTVGKALVVGQLALSLAMVTGASLLVESWRRLTTLDPGFRSDGVLLVTVNARAAGLPAPQREAAFARVLERLRSLPGVSSAATAVRTPIGSNNIDADIEIPGVSAGTRMRVKMNAVSDQYFTSLGTPLLRGRDFDRTDISTSPRVAIINRETARRFFPDGDVGRRFTFVGEPETYEVIGVVEDSKDMELRESTQPQMYLAASQGAYAGPGTSFIVHSENLVAMAGVIRSAILQENARFSLTTRRLRDQVDESIRLPRTLGLLAGFFGFLALTLASIGLYGILSYSVSRRRKEIGVRVALGATQARVVRMIVGDCGRLVIAGVLGGIGLALLTAKTLTAFLFDIAPRDPATFVLSATALVAVAVAAALLPARRAARLDPVAALREE